MPISYTAPFFFIGWLTVNVYLKIIVNDDFCCSIFSKRRKKLLQFKFPSNEFVHEFTLNVCHSILTVVNYFYCTYFIRICKTVYWWNSFSYFNKHLHHLSLTHTRVLYTLIWWRTRYLVYVVVFNVFVCVCIFVPVCSNSLWFVSQCMYLLFFSTSLFTHVHFYYVHVQAYSSSAEKKICYTSKHSPQTHIRSLIRLDRVLYLRFGFITVSMCVMVNSSKRPSNRPTDRPAFPKHLSRCVRAYEQLWKI